MLIPLIIILTPSFAISVKIKEAFVPSFNIFSIVCFIVDFIPIWLLFIIIYASIVYYFTKESKGGLF